MNLNKIGRCVARNGKKKYCVASPEDNDELDLKVFNKINLREGKFQYIPNNEGRDTIGVFGASGSGKSWWISDFVKEYHATYKKNSIYLLSECEEDEVFDEKPYIIRIMINDELLGDKIQWDEFKDCLVILDDVDSLSKEYKKYIDELRNKLLKNARKNNVSVVISNHNFTDGAQTKNILNECTTLVFFMNNAFTRGTKYFLESYVGLDKKGIENIKNLNTRATVYIKSYPQLIMTDKSIITVNELSK